MSTVESSSSAVQQPPSSTLPMLGDNQVSTMQLQMQASTSSSSSSGGGNGSVGVPLDTQSSGEPPAKKQMLDPNAASSSSPSSGGGGSGPAGARSGTNEKLAYRISTALCCAVCLDLPKTAMYQCQMGHLMCAACFTHLLADGRLRDQIATCPNCRVEISKSTASRNLAVEKAASELPSECQFCNKEFPYKSLERHEQHECQERPTKCKYHRIGCQWRGPYHETTEHERNCLHPQKSGYEVMAALEAHDVKIKEEKKMFNTLIDLLSYEKIIFNDLQMKPYRTDEYVHKLFYETARFSAFNQQWVVKARINNSQRDPHQSNERTITYQLILKTKTSTPMSIHFFALKGPFSDMKVSTQIYKHEFTETSTESDYYVLPLPDGNGASGSSECNRMLANKGINFRLLMFLLNK
ncbi:zinc finger TRAF-type-containing protein 1 homolog isoform X2 [Drosophila sulfurigaster albostrigata]|uniref:Zinc finger TRAF-type-containing protein 1 homolog isoform X2 n=1 Tax=Drosophila albomicans TaxID=7291 RepID=A0A6P8WQE1_DROAB|nr:zinc finger TRAF-type-containing protein 1 homolog isoform X2 [Drosophila albomicans]XP_060653533.1 zinc finger TRAF-type-containing protein 1 homolog isoform X2 [Drosophila nasuta]XP_062128648.1 zinc finger TRAF-type-containing protein 1 homolog isoform X2 [Drosophila sulfurigaster albostrigata]